MCGFAGRIRRSHDDDAPPLTAALPQLSARGPDGWHVWTSECGRVELLHARLAIVDPDERALQPFADARGRHIVMFNGEIYNHAELRAGIADYPWRTASDTEVLLAGLSANGIAFLGAARGMFAGVFVDSECQRVSLFRDSIGKKPLIMLRDVDGSILFGSSLRAILALAKNVPGLRVAALREVLAEGFVEPPLGIFEGVEHLTPGAVRHYDFNANAVGVQEISSPCALRYDGEPHDQVLANIASLLDRSVRQRLDSAPFPAVLLSGGIDSTVVALNTQRYCREHGLRLAAFSLKPVIPHTQDAPFAAAAARRLGVDIQWVAPPLRHIGERVIDALDALDEPLAMPAYFVLFELVRAVRPFSKVLLTGEGGDEVFLGYGTPSDWTARSSTLLSGVNVGPPVPTWFGPWARRVAGASLFGHMFQKADRASAGQGVELRAPLLDLDLVQYARSLPLNELLQGGRMKSLLKAQLVGWPERFLERRKLGLPYSLRWSWLASGFSGMREHIDPVIQAALGDALPPTLRTRASRWRHRDIMRNFGAAYALLAVSRTLRGDGPLRLAGR